MTHDPLCPTTDCSQCDESSAEWCVTCGGCRCDLIAKVRADTLNKAIDTANDQRSKFKASDWDDAVAAVVTALGGES